MEETSSTSVKLTIDQQRELLVKQKTQKYADEAKLAKKRIKKLERIRKKVSRDFFKQQILSHVIQNDTNELQQNTSSTDEALNILQKTSNYKIASYEGQSHSLDKLEGNIVSRIDEVKNKVQNLNQAVLEWQTANYIVGQQCQKSCADSAEAFHAWNQYIPILNTFLSNESKIHYSIYLSAQLVGLVDELDAQKDIKQILTDFAEKHYPDVSKSKALPLKQINEQRQQRSEAFDQLHWKLVKQLRYYVRQCDNLQQEIEEREILRSKLVNYSIELKNHLENDYEKSLERADNDAKLSIDKILMFFKTFSLEDKQATTASILEEYLISHKRLKNNNHYHDLINDKSSFEKTNLLDKDSIELLQQILQQTMEGQGGSNRRKEELLQRLSSHDSGDDEHEHEEDQEPLEKRLPEPNNQNISQPVSPEKPNTRKSQDLQQISMISSLSDSLVNEASIYGAPPPETILIPQQPPTIPESSSKPKPPKARKYKKASSSTNNEIPPKPSTAKRFPKEKNLVEEFTKYLNENDHQRSDPLYETRQYIRTISTDFENSINEIFPEVHQNYQSLLNEAFDEITIQDILQKINLISVQNGLNHLQTQQNSITRMMNAPSTLHDALFKQSLETIFEGMDSIRGVQNNCSMVADNAILTVSNLLSKMKNNEEILLFESPSKANKKAVRPKKLQPKFNQFTALDSVTEIDQYIAAQQLISEISHQFATNKSSLESWFVSSVARDYKQSKELLEQKLSSFGMPIRPPEEEEKIAHEKERQKKLKEKELLNSPDKQGKLAKITEADYEDDEVEEHPLDADQFNQKDLAMKEAHYQQIIQRNRLNTEIIRRSFEAPQILEFIKDLGGEDDDMTVKSVQELLQQSEVLINAVNDRISKDEPNPTNLEGKEGDENHHAEILPAMAVSVENFNFDALNDFIHHNDRHATSRPTTTQGSSRPTTTTGSRPSTQTNLEGEIKLLKLELVIKADLYHVSFSYLPPRGEIYVLARYFLQKTMFREYRIFITLNDICTLCELHPDILTSTLFSDTAKACQYLINRIQIELIEKNEFFEYMHARELPLSTTSIPDADLEQLFESYNANFLKNFIPIPGSAHTIPPVDEQNAIKVMTVRNKEGKLFKYCIPTIKTLQERKSITKPNQ